MHTPSPLRRRVAIATLLFVPLLAVAQSASPNRQDRAVSGFSAIALAIPAQVDVQHAQSEGLRIEADENLLPLIETTVEHGTLRIRSTRRDSNFPPGSVHITVQARQLERLSIGGTGTMHADTMQGRKLGVEVGGSGNVVVDKAQGDLLKVSIGGSGNVQVAGGDVRMLKVEIGGSGDVKAAGLRAERADVTIGGSGKTVLWVATALQTMVAGSGDVDYYGDPSVDGATVGSGRVRRLGPAPH